MRTLKTFHKRTPDCATLSALVFGWGCSPRVALRGCAATLTLGSGVERLRRSDYVKRAGLKLSRRSEDQCKLANASVK